MNRGDPIVVAVDVDGVTADLYTELFRMYNEDFNDNKTYQTAMREYESETWDLKPECKDIEAYFDRANLYDNVLPMPGALEGIKYLREEGYRVVFNSSCFINRSDDKLRWLFEHGFLKPAKRLVRDWIVVPDKSLIHANIMIDDRPKNIYKFNGVGIIFDQPYNKRAIAEARLRGWTDIERVMSNLYPTLCESVYGDDD